MARATDQLLEARGLSAQGLRDRVRATGSPARCPWCHAGLEEGDPRVACADCGARHHAECHAELERCASCGSTEALYPRKPTPRRRRRPQGSGIGVIRNAGGCTYRWDANSAGDWGVYLLMLVCPPLLLLVLFGWLLLDEEPDPGKKRMLWLRKQLVGYFVPIDGRARKRLTVRRHKLDRAKVVNRERVDWLVIDVGKQRYRLETGQLKCPLSVTELEWLAEEINAWRDEGPSAVSCKP